MTYAIVSESSKGGVFQVICVACREEMGTMHIDDIRHAILAKGPVICPDCRRRKCDYCGELKGKELEKCTGMDGYGIYHICPSCKKMESDYFNPIYTRHMILASVKDLGRGEAIQQ